MSYLVSVMFKLNECGNFPYFSGLGLLDYKVSDTENVRWHSTCQPLTTELHTEQAQNMFAIADNSPRSWFFSCTFLEVNKNSLFFPSRHVYITTPLFFTNRFSCSDGMYPRKSIYWSPNPQCDLNEVNRVLWYDMTGVYTEEERPNRSST